jgi:hypothetical protein
MRISQNVLICAALALLALPALGAQDLSKYRGFSLETSLALASKQAQVPQEQISTVHKSPALIQQFTLWPVQSAAALEGSENVQQMQLSFCNGELYNITVIYRTAATEGLTNDDMIQAISVRYGLAIRPGTSSKPTAPLSFESVDEQLASWQDSQYSVTLSRSPLSQSFQLVVLSKGLQARADAAAAQSVAQDREDAPQRETARVKKEAEDLQALRDSNRTAFRP